MNTWIYIVKRLMSAIPTMLFITAMVMGILVLGPGEPKIAGRTAALGEGEGNIEQVVEETGESLASYRQKEIYGLNDPWYVQYLHWVVGNDLLGFRKEALITELPNGEKVERYPRRGVLRLDFGPSYTDLRPVPKKIWRAFKVTFLMSLIATLLTYVVAIMIGIYSATNRDTLADKVQTVVVFILYSMPSFWVGTLLILFLTGGDFWHVFPNTGLHSLNYREMPFLRMLVDYGWHLILPVLTLTYGGFAFLSRYSRTSILEVAASEFVRTARAKGLPERDVIWKHIFRNALIPIITLMAGLLPALLGGSIVVEQIFSIPGMGKEIINAITTKDYTMVMALTALSSGLVLLGTLVSDLMYCLVDPRVTLEAQNA